ncbi:MAG: class I SAM-dependent methyltransferase [Bacteroidales bacterium]|nr:class I SAM-dependent methyltransferase [Bacteroidales bacterium]
MDNNGFPTVKKQGINYLTDKNEKIVKFKPWLGDLFSPLYDWSMKKTVVPKKFGASYDKHFSILKVFFKDVHNKDVLEFATGSGSVVDFLPADNRYCGVDISKGLLKQALKKFQKHRFEEVELYLADACNLPFENGRFDVAICNLSFNFIENADAFIRELKRVLKTGGIFFCSVPVPERKPEKSRIHGTLYSETELKELFENQLFAFQSLPETNGAILYFTAYL